MFGGVGGAIWQTILGHCSVLAISIICWAKVSVPMGVVLWCMHMICIAWFSILGYVLNSGGIVGFPYVMVSALK